MFLKNCWYVCAWDHELLDGRLLSRVLLNERVLIVPWRKRQIDCSQ